MSQKPLSVRISDDDLYHLTRASKQAEILQIEAKAILGFAADLIKNKYGVGLDEVRISDGIIIRPDPVEQGDRPDIKLATESGE